MRTRRIVKFQLFLVMALIMMTWSCRKNTADYSRIAPFKIRIGALISLSGTGSSTGESSDVALRLARENVEAQLNTIGYMVSVELRVEDTQTDTAIALQKLKKLFSEGIRLVIGPYSSAEVAHLKPFADQNRMLIVSPSSVAASLALPNDNIFRFVTSDEVQAEAMTKMLTEDEIRVIVPLIRDDVWGDDLLQSVVTNFQHSGGKIHDAVKYDPSTTGFTSLLEQLNANVALEMDQYNPEEIAVYLACFGEGASILKAAGNFTNLSDVSWYGSSAFAQNGAAISDPEAGSFATGHLFPCPIYGLDEAAHFKWQPIRAEISMIIGRTPDVYALTAYDALWVAATTYAMIGSSPDIDQLKYVYTTVADDYFGITGNTTLNQNGDRTFGNYDFWAINDTSGIYTWDRVAVYNSATGTLTRY